MESSGVSQRGRRSLPVCQRSVGVFVRVILAWCSHGIVSHGIVRVSCLGGDTDARSVIQFAIMICLDSMEQNTSMNPKPASHGWESTKHDVQTHCFS
jgi:hypothetical protein